MAIKYLGIKKKSPKDVDDRTLDRWYAQAKSVNELDYNELCERISHSSTATKGDVALVIESLLYHMMGALATGEIVRLGNFGSFRTTVSSEGVENKLDVNNNLIRSARIVFTPGKALKTMIKGASFSMLPDRYWPVPKF